MSTDIESVLSLMSDKMARIEAELLNLKGQPSQAASRPSIPMANMQRNVNGLAMANTYYTHIYGSGTITIPNTAWTALPFINVRSIQNGSMWIGEYPTRIWACVDGWIDYDAVVQLPVTSGMIGAYFRHGGATQISEMAHASGTLGSALHPHFTYPMRAGEYVELMVLQTSGTDKNVTVTNYVSPELRAITLPININPAAGTPKTIMMCGDSKTAINDGRHRIYLQDIFMAANKRVTWVGAVNGRVNGDPVGMESFHSAISGQYTDTIRALVAAATIAPAPDVVVIWTGTNDLLRGDSLGTIQTNYTGFITDLFARWPSCTIVCCTVEQNFTGSASAFLYNPASLNTWISGLPATYGAQLKVADIAAVTNFSTLYAGDGLHIDGPRGNWLAAWTVWNQIKTLMG